MRSSYPTYHRNKIEEQNKTTLFTYHTLYRAMMQEYNTYTYTHTHTCAYGYSFTYIILRFNRGTSLY